MGKAGREKSVRERIKEQQQAARAAEKRRRMLTYAAVGVVALAAIGGGWFYTYSQSRSEQPAAGPLAPITVQPDGSVAMAKQGVAKPVIDVYEDFQCPGCQQFEELSGPTLKNLAFEGKAKVVYHPITIFGQEPLKSNSVRAAAALRCVPGGEPWMRLHDKLFQEQPREGDVGFQMADLVAWGKEAGVTAPGFEQCVTSQQHAQAHLAYSGKTMKEAAIEGTPTVKLDGQALEGEQLSPVGLRQAVEDAAK
ncbi:DsbA family protein [Thermoactinospora rubra]|uniref:DsbA family protein n=1 Tax=Thermoactinospora rubra TaxID=1088767 RepID=UPI000A105332|nr:thioredoxin domain-containing protein [Thermoactinospora rubra]